MGNDLKSSEIEVIFVSKDAPIPTKLSSTVIDDHLNAIAERD